MDALIGVERLRLVHHNDVGRCLGDAAARQLVEIHVGAVQQYRASGLNASRIVAQEQIRCQRDFRCRNVDHRDVVALQRDGGGRLCIEPSRAVDGKRAFAGLDAAVDAQLFGVRGACNQSAIGKLQSRIGDLRRKAIDTRLAGHGRFRQRAAKTEFAIDAAFHVGQRIGEQADEGEIIQMQADLAAERLLRSRERNLAVQTSVSIERGTQSGLLIARRKVGAEREILVGEQWLVGMLVVGDAPLWRGDRGIAGKHARGGAMNFPVAFERALGADRHVADAGRIYHQRQRHGMQAIADVEIAGFVQFSGRAQQRLAGGKA
jgi:hypothetical protein